MPSRGLLAFILPASLLLAPACKPGGAATEEPNAVAVTFTGMPTPAGVCKHLMEVAAAEAGVEPEFEPEVMEPCRAELEAEAEVRGAQNWNAVATCVLKAQDAAGIEACNATYPIPEHAGEGMVPDAAPADPTPAPAPTADSREARVCDHMLDIMLTEESQASGEIVTLDDAERADLTAACLDELATARAEDPDGYEQKIECLAQAKDGEQADACG